MEIYIQENGSSLRKEREHFIIEAKEKITRISPKQITSIIMEDNASITTNAIKLAIENDIPIFLSDNIGNIYGKLWKPFFGKNSMIRLRQLKVFSSEYGKTLGKKWILNKIINQKTHIIKIYNKRKINYSEKAKYFDEIIKKINLIDCKKNNFSNIIMGYEGIASKLYYESISKVLPPNINFTGRNNHNPKDIYNIALNYSFGVLYTTINHLLTISGFDTKIGILHSNLNEKDSFLYDFIEQYRFISWEVVFGLFSKKIFNKEYLDEKTNILTIEARRVILNEMYNKLHKITNYKNKRSSYYEIIKKEIYELKEELLNNELYSSL